MMIRHGVGVRWGIKQKMCRAIGGGEWMGIRSEYLRREVYLWDFYEAELYQNSGDKLSLEFQIRSNILCEEIQGERCMLLSHKK
jgi:hypothetical protein